MVEKSSLNDPVGRTKSRSKFATAYRLLRNYGLDRITGKPSTAGFWYLREAARVHDATSYRHYLDSATPSPLYLMNYESKLAYDHKNTDGIIVLPYSEPIGDQINPEAAFIYALAVHDAHQTGGGAERWKEFLRYADFFRKAQSENGDWPYLFDWPGNPAPWRSALAQGRGASFMLRAFLLTKDESFAAAACKALMNFDVPTEQGGYQAFHRLTGMPYYEEYPNRPSGVMNGFMASLLGCWEVAHWLNDKSARGLFDQGIESLIAMTPHYLVNGWSVYDLDPKFEDANYNTPRYHRLVLSYFEVLTMLSEDEKIANLRDQWAACLGSFNEARALALKFRWKLRHGVFSS